MLPKGVDANMEITKIGKKEIFELGDTPDAFSWVWEAEQELREALERKEKETSGHQKQEHQDKRR